MILFHTDLADFTEAHALSLVCAIRMVNSSETMRFLCAISEIRVR